LDLNDLNNRKKKLPRKEKLNLDKVKMNFDCGWEECDFESSCIKDYFEHVSDHVNYLWTEEWQSNSQSMSISYLFKNILNVFLFMFRMVFMFLE